MKTDVHFPTDISLLVDAVRTALRLCVQASEQFGLDGWRQADCHLRSIRRLYRSGQNRKAFNAKDPKKVAAREQAIADAHCALLVRASALLPKIDSTLEALSKRVETVFLVNSIERYRLW